MKQHILVISQYFYPEQFRINDICQEWVYRGYKVTVVTGIPNYPQGEFYSGYSWFHNRKEEYKGIHIIRLPLIPRGKSAFILMLNYLSFVISGWFWGMNTRIKADKVFIFEVSPMTQALVGVWYAKRKSLPCFIYVQDLWPENVEVVTGIHNKWILGAISRMTNYIYANCKKIFATSPSFAARIEERKAAYQEGKSKVIYWPQYAESFYQPVPKEALEDMPEGEVFQVIFTGNIGYAQGLDILPQIAEKLQAQRELCKFVIIGDGRYKKELEKEIASRKVEAMFVFAGRKQPQEIPRYLAHCNVAFLSFMNNSLFTMTIPAKLQSYMACGMPILAVAEGETRRVIEEADCGVCCGFNKIDDIVQKILWMKQNPTELIEMGKRALEYQNAYFEQQKLLDLIENYMELCENR